MFCAKCGKEIPEDSEFCGYCGATAAAPAAAAAAQQVPPPAPPPPPVSEPPPGGVAPPMGTGVPAAPYGPQPPKKSPLPWILGILGVLAVVVVVLVLVFVVFKGDDNGGNGGAAENPEKTVEAFFESMEKKDARMLLGTMEPDFVEQIEDVLGEDYIDLMDEYFFAEFPDDLEIDIKKMDKEIMGDKAEVTIVDGTMSFTDEYGDKVTQEAADVDMDAFELVKVDGEWYLSEDTLIDLGFDFSGLSDSGLSDGLDTGDDGTTDSGYDTGLVELPVDTEDEALTLIFEVEEIWDWYMETDLPSYDISEESDRWVVYLYEFDENGNEVAFAWYEVDKKTGDVFMITNE